MVDKETEKEMTDYDGVVVMVPCLNEERTVGKVVSDFKAALPGARIFVYDNNSTDNTATVAREYGATVVHAPRKGKGNVVKQMFSELEGDVFVMVDGDDTYPASSAPALLEELSQSGADMVVGVRTVTHKSGSFRLFHKFGNSLVAGLISLLFSTRVTDVMSGYRVMSRTFIKSAPLMSEGFDIETEMTLQALAKDFRIKEVLITYGERPEGSHSKLNTYMDGMLVLKTIFLIFKDYKPLLFFGMLSLLLAASSLAAGFRPVLDYIEKGFVYHVPLAILASGLGVLSAGSLAIGLVLDTLSKYHNENSVLWRRAFTKKSPDG